MGLFSAQRQQERVSPFAYPEIPPNSAAGGVLNRVAAEVYTPESSMRKIAVASSVRLIAGVISSFPVDGFTGSGTGRRPIALPQFFVNPDGSSQGFDDWVNQLLFSWLLRGNVYGLILDVDSMGRPAVVQLQHPDRVSTRTASDGKTTWYVNGQETDPAKIWHRRVYPVPGRIHGLSPIALHAMTIGEGLAAGTFGLNYFLDGAHPSAILQQESSETITQQQAETVKARFIAALRGSKREPVVLGKGWTYKPIQVSPEESQFLDTQKYTAAECARIFGPGMPEVLGYETGGSMTYANVEQRSIDLLKFTLNPWITRIERVLSRDMLAQPRYVKFNRGALLATDLLTRFKAHEISLKNQWAVVNEIRELEDEPPVPWGDQPNVSSPAPSTVETAP